MLPITIQVQLCGKRGITGGVLRSGIGLLQSMAKVDCRKVHGEHITLQAADAERSVA
ncbi:MAG: hypothetical protein R6U89_05440 [Dehalococcoidia bacterium]